jgi:hypothetical protein
VIAGPISYKQEPMFDPGRVIRMMMG